MRRIRSARPRPPLRRRPMRVRLGSPRGGARSGSHGRPEAGSARPRELPAPWAGPPQLPRPPEARLPGSARVRKQWRPWTATAKLARQPRRPAYAVARPRSGSRRELAVGFDLMEGQGTHRVDPVFSGLAHDQLVEHVLAVGFDGGHGQPRPLAGLRLGRGQRVALDPAADDSGPGEVMPVVGLREVVPRVVESIAI